VVYRYKDTVKFIKNPINVTNNTPAIACWSLHTLTENVVYHQYLYGQPGVSGVYIIRVIISQTARCRIIQYVIRQSQIRRIQHDK